VNGALLAGGDVTSFLSAQRFSKCDEEDSPAILFQCGPITFAEFQPLNIHRTSYARHKHLGRELKFNGTGRSKVKEIIGSCRYAPFGRGKLSQLHKARFRALLTFTDQEVPFIRIKQRLRLKPTLRRNLAQSI
jgi:hypothetical protein